MPSHTVFILLIHRSCCKYKENIETTLPLPTRFFRVQINAVNDSISSHHQGVHHSQKQCRFSATRHRIHVHDRRDDNEVLLP